MTRTTHQRTIALATTLILLMSACGGGDNSDAEPAATEPRSSTAPAPTSPPSTSAGEGADTTDTATGTTSPLQSTTTTIAAADCPDPPTGETTRPDPPEPVEPDATELAEADGTMDGRYRTEELRVAMAFDAPPPYAFSNLVSADRIQFGAAPLGYISMVRPAEAVDFDQWLAEAGESIEIVEDADLVVDGRPARSVTYVPGPSFPPPDFSLGEYGYNAEGNQPNRIVRIDLGDGLAPLFIIFDSFADGADYVDQTASWLDTMRLGEAVPNEVPAAPEWDTASADVEVDGPCSISSLAFDGVGFEVAEASLIVGLGDQLLVRDDSGSHVGVHAPLIVVSRPQAAWITPDGWDGDREVGAAIESADDVIIQLETQGWTITGTSDGAELLGAPATLIEATGPDTPSWLWQATASPVREADELSVDPFRTAEFLVAETERGLIVASLEWERDTDDDTILRERFDRLVATLTSS